MTDQKFQMLVAVDTTGKVTSRRFHLFSDCSFLADEKTEQLKTSEVALLGLKVCAVCDKRAKGGPALDALEAVFENFGDSRDSKAEAWAVFNALKVQGFYIAQRQPKSL